MVCVCSMGHAVGPALEQETVSYRLPASLQSFGHSRACVRLVHVTDTDRYKSYISQRFAVCCVAPHMLSCMLLQAAGILASFSELAQQQAAQEDGMGMQDQEQSEEQEGMRQDEGWQQVGTGAD